MSGVPVESVKLTPHLVTFGRFVLRIPGVYSSNFQADPDVMSESDSANRHLVNDCGPGDGTNIFPALHLDCQA